MISVSKPCTCFLCKKRFADHLLFKCKCGNFYCLKDVILEKHNCSGLSDYKKESFDNNLKNLMKNATELIKVDII